MRRNSFREIMASLSALACSVCLQGCTQKAAPSATLLLSQATAAEQGENAPPATAPTAKSPASAQKNQPKKRVTAKPVVAEYSANVPKVLLTAEHAALCKARVGDVFPGFELPQIGSGPTKISTFAGSKATVILFWTPTHWMSRAALTDIAKDVSAKARDSTIGVIGVAESPTAEAAQEVMTQAGAKFAQLLDAEGSGLAQVGADALPRVYVLDSSQKISWFDIEYSEATRRELQQTLAALTAK
jgi:peroxiredoxin